MINQIFITTNFDVLPIQSSGIIFNTADKGTSLQKNKL